MLHWVKSQMPSMKQVANTEETCNCILIFAFFLGYALGLSGKKAPKVCQFRYFTDQTLLVSHLNQYIFQKTLFSRH